MSMGLATCQYPQQQPMDQAKPETNELTEAGKDLEDSLKAVYRRELYFAAPGTNVDSIRHQNWLLNYQHKQEMRAQVSPRSGEESFAGGLLQATWHERGPNNEAGDMREIDFLPGNEALYALSTEGHLWKGNLNGATWALLNDDIQFEPDEIEVVPHNGGTRIFAIYGLGTDDKVIRYSDDEGQNWTKGTGFSFYDHWGRGRRLLTLSDNQTLYYLVNTWSASPWGSIVQLYKTTNKGVSYTKVWESGTGYSSNSEEIDLWKPYDSDQMYLVDNKTQQFYTVSHNFGTNATTISSPVSYAGQGVTTGKISVSGRYNTSMSNYELFMCTNSDKKVYKTTTGSTWTYLSTATTDVWRKGWLADPDNNNLYAGGFQVNKSVNTTAWAELYSQWWEYYKNTPTQKDSLHVDIMNLEYFKKSNGTPFILILNHSGVHVTYNRFVTTANLGLSSLNAVTLYDQTTATDGFLYCGAQDKGTFKYGGNSLANFNMLATDNMNTGDGMLGVFFNSDQSFYGMLQNGSIACFKNRNIRSSSSFDIPGTNKPGWVNPMVATPDFTDNKAYVAGGNLSGGAGSYLITANVNITSGVVWQNTQFSYNFLSNSNNGTSVIKAIGVAQSDYNRMYVSTQDATFFSSADQGTNWTKQTGAGLPTTMIPWDIKTSTTNADKVFICGTGFSNTGVYQSINGGTTFTPLSGSIPLATFYEIALSDNEQILFAATSEGPYAYIFNTSTWYSLSGAETPIADFNTVDNIGSSIIRFGTYGRGIWDLALSTPLQVTYQSFEAEAMDNRQVRLRWATAAEQQVVDFEVQKSDDGARFSTFTMVKPQNQASQYTVIDPQPNVGTTYYRIKSLDLSGHIDLTPIRSVHLADKGWAIAVFPTMLPKNTPLSIELPEEGFEFFLYDLQGHILVQQLLTSSSNQVPMPNLSTGVYFYAIREGNKQVVKNGKLMML